MTMITKPTRLKSVMRVAVVSCLLWAHFEAKSPVMLAQQPPSVSGQGGVEVRLDFTAQVYREKTKEPVVNLTKDDFRLFEDKREQTILSVTRDSRPLSIVAIVTLGRGELCEGMVSNSTVSRTMTNLAQAFTQVLKPEDELSVMITDKDTTLVRPFNASPERIIADFAEVGRISEANEKLFPGWGKSGRPHLDVKNNYVGEALGKAIDYLKQNKKSANRPVILFLRQLTHEHSLPWDLEEQLRQRLLQAGVIVGSFGKNRPSWLEGYYEDLPDLTGGDKESCYPFAKATEPTKPTAIVSAVLERLRTRYHISYVSTNPQGDGQMRQLKLELAPSWKKVKDKPEVRAPQALLAPRF